MGGLVVSEIAKIAELSYFLNSALMSHFHNGRLLRKLNDHPIWLWPY